MNNKLKKIVGIGAGNVGKPAVMGLADLHAAGILKGEFTWVDYDAIDRKCVGRALYPKKYLSYFKTQALSSMILENYEPETADAFKFLNIDIRNAPGLILEADTIINCVDNNADAAFSSQLGINIPEIRISTGMEGNIAIYTVEYCPPGISLADVYDKRTWQDSAGNIKHSCLTGEIVNNFASVKQPFGALPAWIALTLLLENCEENRYMTIRVHGTKISQSYSEKVGKPVETLDISFLYDLTMRDLFQVVSSTLGESEEIRLRLCAPVVRRICSKHGEKYIGFELYPLGNVVCDCGRKTILETSMREIEVNDLEALEIGDKSLRELNAPAGLVFNTAIKNGPTYRCRLPFLLTDIPNLPAIAESINAYRKEEKNENAIECRL